MSDADPAGARLRFEGTWMRWHVLRAVASTAAFGCLTGAPVVTRSGL